MLPFQIFKEIVEHTPLVSIDFVVRAPDKKVLLGKRVNRPAKEYWFVPGGRILKNETFKESFERLLDEELGLKVSDIKIKPLGVYQHFYEDSFSTDSFGTHYIVLAYELNLSSEMYSFPCIQHSDYKWINVNKLLKSNMVHEHTKWYFLNNKNADHGLHDFLCETQ